MNLSESNWGPQSWEAEISLSYETITEARAVADAVSPDNVKMPEDLSIKTIHLRRNVLTMVECKSSLSTFIATIDDLLEAISIAERSVLSVKRC